MVKELLWMAIYIITINLLHVITCLYNSSRVTLDNIFLWVCNYSYKIGTILITDSSILWSLLCLNTCLWSFSCYSHPILCTGLYERSVSLLYYRRKHGTGRCGYTWGRPMSSSGFRRLSADMMMMMMMNRRVRILNNQFTKFVATLSASISDIITIQKVT